MFILMLLFSSMHPVSAYTPQKGDYFKYTENTIVNNGSGVYTGYQDQTLTNGTESVTNVSGSSVTTAFAYTYSYSSNQGSKTAGSNQSSYVWSTKSYTYTSGSDEGVGFGGIPFSTPLYVWWAINPNVSVGSKLFLLNTEFTVQTLNYSFQVPGQGYIKSIEVLGSGVYQRNDTYGVMQARYNWAEYFDPSTGYIIGYIYSEQDNGQWQGQAGGFSYTDTLYETQTSYPLVIVSATTASAASTVSTSTINSGAFIDLLIVALIVVFLVVVAVAMSRRRHSRDDLPRHSTYSSSPPNVHFDTGRPSEVVERQTEVYKCPYCSGTYPITRQNCPLCGAPRV